jgi:hypothetical protein
MSKPEKQMSKARALALIGICPCLAAREAGIMFLYCNGSLKMLVVPAAAMTELLSCKLLSTLAAGIKQVYFT